MASLSFQQPNTIVSNSGKVYSPLSRPSTAPASKKWMPPQSSVHSSQAIDFKRIPTNPRYGSVQAKTDSGWSARKVEAKFGAQNSARYRRSEPFKRIKPSNLASIIREGRENVLVLDLRSQEEYEQCRVKGASSYPAQMMSRSMYQYTPEILAFKNKEGCLMVLYDFEERLSVSVGTHWYEKGIDNFVVLSGGLAALLHADADAVDGDPSPLLDSLTPPPSLAASPMKSSPARAPPRPGTAGARPGTAGTHTRHMPSSAGIATASAGPLSVPRPARWEPLQATARVSSVQSFRGSYDYGFGGM